MYYLLINIVCAIFSSYFVVKAMEKPRREKIREVESIINWIEKEEDNLKKTVEKLRENRLRLERWVREEKKSSVSLVLVLGCTTPDTSNISLRNTGKFSHISLHTVQ